MSAYLVNDNTINTILSGVPAKYFYQRREQMEKIRLLLFDTLDLDQMPDDANTSDGMLQLIGRELLSENLRSVNHRYAGYDDETPPEIYYFKRINTPSVAQLLKSCDCLEYQSCETDDYEQTKAFKLLTWLRRVVVTSHADYNAAKWA